ncbi:MAG TPA: phosphate ABC transporter permease family protein, partial [Polyangiaceae bacterium]|nr:phosphate ABC transporter permease family protein [Polyangiaceae bacterium]
MGFVVFVVGLLGLMGVGYALGQQRALVLANAARREMHSLPEHHGVLVALCSGVPALVILLIGSLLPLSLGSFGVPAAALAAGGVGAWLARRAIHPK